MQPQDSNNKARWTPIVIPNVPKPPIVRASQSAAPTAITAPTRDPRVIIPQDKMIPNSQTGLRSRMEPQKSATNASTDKQTTFPRADRADDSATHGKPTTGVRSSGSSASSSATTMKQDGRDDADVKAKTAQAETKASAASTKAVDDTSSSKARKRTRADSESEGLHPERKSSSDSQRAATSSPVSNKRTEPTSDAVPALKLIVTQKNAGSGLTIAPGNKSSPSKATVELGDGVPLKKRARTDPDGADSESGRAGKGSSSEHISNAYTALLEARFADSVSLCNYVEATFNRSEWGDLQLVRGQAHWRLGNLETADRDFREWTVGAPGHPFADQLWREFGAAVMGYEAAKQAQLNHVQAGDNRPSPSKRAQEKSPSPVPVVTATATAAKRVSFTDECGSDRSPASTPRDAPASAPRDAPASAPRDAPASGQASATAAGADSVSTVGHTDQASVEAVNSAAVFWETAVTVPMETEIPATAAAEIVPRASSTSTSTPATPTQQEQYQPGGATFNTYFPQPDVHRDQVPNHNKVESLSLPIVERSKQAYDARKESNLRTVTPTAPARASFDSLQLSQSQMSSTISEADTEPTAMHDTTLSSSTSSYAGDWQLLHQRQREAYIAHENAASKQRGMDFAQRKSPHSMCRYGAASSAWMAMQQRHRQMLMASQMVAFAMACAPDAGMDDVFGLTPFFGGFGGRFPGGSMGMPADVMFVGFQHADAAFGYAAAAAARVPTFAFPVETGAEMYPEDAIRGRFGGMSQHAYAHDDGTMMRACSHGCLQRHH